jgi:hypothetical protein
MTDERLAAEADECRTQAQAVQVYAKALREGIFRPQRLNAVITLHWGLPALWRIKWQAWKIVEDEDAKRMAS